jgi:hypothetical protein
MAGEIPRVVTKADVYEEVILTERPVCPYCGGKMRIWECQDCGLSCHAGWGTPYLFICADDECPLYVNGWEEMKKNYGRTCSYRCIYLPGAGGTETMAVFSSRDCISELLDEETVAADRLRGTAMDPVVQQLIASFKGKDLAALQENLLDDTTYWKTKAEAAALVGELGPLELLELLESTIFRDKRVAGAVQNAIKRIHEINQTRECPYCKEVVTAELTICSQCGRPLKPE